MSLALIASYVLFSFFLFYQQLHVKTFNGASQGFFGLLNIFAFAGMLFGFAFLLLYGYNVSWLGALGLFGASLALKLVWFPVEAKLGLRNATPILSLAGFVVIPVSGYFMWQAIP